MPKIWSWKLSPGKGKGVFATLPLETGALIMRDVETMTTSHKVQKGDPIQDSFDRLSPAEQAEYLQLHEGDQPLPSRVQRIFKANAFNSKDGDWGFVYLDICKANHSCIPNAEVLPDEDDSLSKPRLVAIKPIAKDEEIFITYNTILHMKPRNERREYLRQHFDFECSCSVCTADPHTVAMSDARRIILGIMFLSMQDEGAENLPLLEAMRREAFSKSSPEVVSKWQSLIAASPLVVKCSFNLLIARILEAEGLSCYQAGSAYLDAGTLLLSQMQERNDGIVLLGAAENVKTWIKKGSHIVATLHGADSLTGKWANDYASNMEDNSFELFMAKEFQDQKHSMEDAARRGKDVKLLKRLRTAFALQFNFQHDGTATLNPVSEWECKRIVRHHLIDPAAKSDGAQAMDVYMEDCYGPEEVHHQ